LDNIVVETQAFVVPTSPTPEPLCLFLDCKAVSACTQERGGGEEEMKREKRERKRLRSR
jgi:hypothetical protein